jgi:hypothetical protein
MRLFYLEHFFLFFLIVKILHTILFKIMRKENRNWLEELKNKANEDNAIDLKIDGKKLKECNKINRSTKCIFLCVCGNVGNKAVKNIIESTGFLCKTCINKTRAEKSSIIQNKLCFEDLKKQIIQDNATNITIDGNKLEDCNRAKRKSKCNFTCHCGNEGEKKVVNILLTGALCITCKKQRRNKVFKETCLKKYGVENISQINDVKKKKKETCFKNYGVENPSQSEEVMKKAIETNIKKYGCSFPTQNEEVREKAKESFITKYGVENPFQSEEVKQQIKKTCLKKYGNENLNQCKEIRDKIKATCLKKYGVEHSLQSKEVRDKGNETILKKYGVKHVMRNENVRNKAKATCLKKYGVEHPMHNKELFEKNQRKRFKMKTYEFNCNNKVECQGDEPFALKELEEKYDYTYEDYIYWNDLQFWYTTKDKKHHKYYPDIPFLRENKIIEVKSNYTFYADLYENILKAKCVIEKGLNFEFWIYDNKKNKLVLEIDLFKNNDVDEIIEFYLEYYEELMV